MKSKVYIDEAKDITSHKKIKNAQKVIREVTKQYFKETTKEK